VSVRDQDSQRILEELGVEGVELTADSAFFARPAAEEETRALLAAHGVDPGASLLVVAPRLLSAERKRLYLEEEMGPDLIRETPDRLAAAVDRVAHRFDRVVLVAMHYHGPDSDVPIIRETVARLSSPNAVFLDRELGAEQAIALFRRARLLLGVRLHALLLAASMGTPVVGLAYERKVRSLFERLALEAYCLDLFDFDEARLVRAMEAALAEEAGIRRHLQERVGTLRDLVLESARRALRVGELPSRDAGALRR
jgi:polysaccharide pyruvyl transferase WcaK-like protein